MLIHTLLLALAGAPDLTLTEPALTCTLTGHTFEASNRTQQPLVLSFASPDRVAALHLAIPAHASLSFHFPAQALSHHWFEVTRICEGRFASTGAMRLSTPGFFTIHEQGNTLTGSEALGSLLPDSIAVHTQFPTCARPFDVGVPPPSEDPIVDDITDLRRRCRRPI